MAIDSEILERQGLIFGFWQQGNDKYYFGHIPDEQSTGKVDITYGKGSNATLEYSINKTEKGFELLISNFEYIISKLGEREMVLTGPGDSKTIFEKLPNKITYSM